MRVLALHADHVMEARGVGEGVTDQSGHDGIARCKLQSQGEVVVAKRWRTNVIGRRKEGSPGAKTIGSKWLCVQDSGNVSNRFSLFSLGRFLKQPSDKEPGPQPKRACARSYHTLHRSHARTQGQAESGVLHRSQLLGRMQTRVV